MYLSQIIMLNTLNLHSAVSQLYIRITGRKKKTYTGKNWGEKLEKGKFCRTLKGRIIGFSIKSKKMSLAQSSVSLYILQAGVSKTH